MIYRLGREGSDGKGISEDLDGPPRCAVLARSGDTGLRGLRFRLGLHGILYFFLLQRSIDTHKER